MLDEIREEGSSFLDFEVELVDDVLQSHGVFLEVVVTLFDVFPEISLIEIFALVIGSLENFLDDLRGDWGFEGRLWLGCGNGLELEELDASLDLLWVAYFGMLFGRGGVGEIGLFLFLILRRVHPRGGCW